MRRSMTQVDDQNVDDMARAQNGNENSPPIEINELLRDFKPEESFIDRMLLYQITGRELNECMS